MWSLHAPSSSLKPLLDKRYQATVGTGLLLFILGVLLSESLHNDTGVFWGLWTALALVLSLVWLARKGSTSREKRLLSLGLLCLTTGGLFSWTLEELAPTAYLTQWQNQRGRPHRIIATCDAPWRASHSGPARWVMTLVEVDGQAQSGRILVSLPKSASTSPLRIGQRVRLAGELQEADGPLFPGDFSYRDYLRLHGIHGVLRSAFVDTLPSDSPGWQQAINQAQNMAISAREQMISAFRATLSAENADLLGSIVLGEHAVGMDEAIKSHFRGLGLAHLLAASGLNVGLVAGFSLLVGTLLRLPFRVNGLLSMGLVLVYAYMTGMPPSILRAATMFELGLLLKLWNRELSAPFLLCLTGWLLCVFDPKLTLQLGFQLSFLSTLGILVLTPRLTQWLGYWLSPTVAGIVVVPLIAQLWVLPLQLCVFQDVSLMALPANIIVLPVVALLTVVGFVSGGVCLALSAFPSVAQALSPALLWPADTLCNALFAISNALPEAELSLGLASPFWGGLCLISVGVLSYWLMANRWPLGRSQTGLALAGLGLMLILPLSLAKWASQQHNHIVILSAKSDNGAYRHASNILVEAASGTKSLYLGARDWKSLASLKTYLRHHHIQRLDTLILGEARAHEKIYADALRDCLAKVQANHVVILSPAIQAQDDAKTAIPLGDIISTPLTTMLPESAVYWFQAQATSGSANKQRIEWAIASPSDEKALGGIRFGGQGLSGIQTQIEAGNSSRYPRFRDIHIQVDETRPSRP